MQMIFSTNTGQTEQLLQTLLSDQFVLWDIVICMLFRGGKYSEKRQQQIRLQIRIYRRIGKSKMGLKARRTKLFRELSCFMWMKLPSVCRSPHTDVYSVKH